MVGTGGALHEFLRPRCDVDDIALVGEADAVEWSAVDWASWRSSEFSAAGLADDNISGLGPDPDHDGRPNRAEWYLLGSAWDYDSGPWCSLQHQGGMATLNYDRRAGPDAAESIENGVARVCPNFALRDLLCSGNGRSMLII